MSFSRGIVSDMAPERCLAQRSQTGCEAVLRTRCRKGRTHSDRDCTFRKQPSTVFRRSRATSLPARRQKPVAPQAQFCFEVAALQCAVTGASSACCSFLNSQPAVANAVIYCVTYGLGDLIAQRKTCWEKVDQQRFRNFLVSGVGSGVLWTVWYELMEASLIRTGLGATGAIAVGLSVFMEQFVWSPIFFAGYFLPLLSLLKGNRQPKRIWADTWAELGPMLWANAKVWTVLNIVIYSAPLYLRAPISNVGCLLWSIYMSFLVQQEASQKHEPQQQPAA